MDITQIIKLSTGNMNTVSTGNLINATPNSPAFIADCIYNKSKSNIHLLRFETFDQNIDGKLLFSTDFNQILRSCEQKDSPSILFEYACTPYFVWTFEHEDQQYKAGHLWDENVIDLI